MYDRVLSISEMRRLVIGGEITMAQAADVSLDPDQLLVDAADPDSDDYAADVLRIWSRLTGRDSYDADVDELFDLDVAQYFSSPYPYTSGDPDAVSVYMGAVAHAIRLIGARPPARVVELGTGWGHLATMIASTGYRTTAVDLNPKSLALLRKRSEALGLGLDVVQSNFLDFDTDEPVDCFVFYEAFHHCASPARLIDRCTDMLSDGGRLLFVAEPFYEWYHQPWGLRPDGHAAIMMVSEGWLELGYSFDYILELFLSRGLRAERISVDSLGPAAGLFVTATKRSCPIDVGEELQPGSDRESWDLAPGWPGPGMFASTSGSRFLLPDRADVAIVALRNLGSRPVTVSAEAGGTVASLSLGAGERREIPVGVGGGRRRLVVTSSQSPAVAIGMGDGIGVLVEAIGTG